MAKSTAALPDFSLSAAGGEHFMQLYASITSVL
jgi:uncharacterized membrane protein